jgi:hypothetical protein
VTRKASHLLRVATVAALLAGTLALEGLVLAAETRAAKESQTKPTDLEPELSSAPVVIDGDMLFRVRGTSAFSAERRAAAIAGRIEALAADPSVSADAVRPVEIDSGTAIDAEGHRVMVVVEADARRESLDRKVLAEVTVSAIRKAVADYRRARSREALIGSAVRGGAATAILAALVALAVWGSTRAQTALEARYRQRVQSVGFQSFQLVRAEQI